MKLLDSGYWEFIDTLERLGELESMARMIDRLSHHEDGPSNQAGSLNQLRNRNLSLEESKTGVIYEFWKVGWIDACEVKSKCKNRGAKKYRMKICLDEISRYFAQETPERSILAADFRYQQTAEIST